uniref:Peptidase S1 domain-containing protein n=1 Tax=Panagrellus redivivus TaxID=6233 RepID=A0A7E4UQ50_PANRE
MVIAGFGKYVGEEYYPNGARNGTLIRKKYGKLPDFARLLGVLAGSAENAVILVNRPLSEFCAGGMRRGVLYGDSGGPVMKVEAKRVVQIGVTSRGYVFAVNERPFQNAIYVTVGHHSKWIAEKTNGTAQFRPVYDPCN